MSRKREEFVLFTKARFWHRLRPAGRTTLCGKPLTFLRAVTNEWPRPRCKNCMLYYKDKL